MSDKPIRLSKAASELNVGLPTLIEFLSSKGISIDSNPNSKLDPEHYGLLRAEFAADQTLKEQAKSIVAKERKESISLKDSRKEEEEKSASKPEAEEDINLEEIKRKVLAPEPTINVVGKIDLDKLNPKKKAEPEPPKPKIETPAPPPVVEEKPLPVEESQPEMIKVERTVLSGLTVLGKIELPVERHNTTFHPGFIVFISLRSPTFVPPQMFHFPHLDHHH